MIALVLIVLVVVAIVYVQQPRMAPQEEAEKREETEQVQPRPTMSAMVYYLGSGEQLVALKRTVPQSPSTDQQVQNALQELMQDPTEKNISSAIPAGTRILNVEVKNRIAYTDFSKELENMGGTAQVQAALDQIVYTTTAVDGVDKVRLLIEGKAIDTFTGEGFMVDQPLGREN